MRSLVTAIVLIVKVKAGLRCVQFNGQHHRYSFRHTIRNYAGLFFRQAIARRTAISVG